MPRASIGSIDQCRSHRLSAVFQDHANSIASMRTAAPEHAQPFVRAASGRIQLLFRFVQAYGVCRLLRGFVRSGVVNFGRPSKVHRTGWNDCGVGKIMSDSEVLVLGTIAGFTIFLGLPIGRLRNPSLRLKAFLNAIAIGILLFLFWDVLAGAFDQVETALTDASDHGGSWYRFIGLAALFFGAIAVGLLSLVYYDRWLAGRRRGGPGAASVRELTAGPIVGSASLSVSRSSSLLASVSTTSLKASQSANPRPAARSASRCCSSSDSGSTTPPKASASSLRWPPKASDRPGASSSCSDLSAAVRPSSAHSSASPFVNDTLYLAFLSLAAGSILYVVIELLGVARKLGHKEIATWGIMLGIFAGFATDLILVAAGA